MKKILFILFIIALNSVAFSQALQLRKPASGGIWPAYSMQRIEWTSTNVDNIKIESSLDSGKTWSIIINSYPASAQLFEWTVPNKVSDSCYIRITDVLNATVASSNYKNNPFKIPAAGIVLDSLPAIVQAGTVFPIMWTSSGIRKVNLYLSLDNKISFTKIADTLTANTYYYNWKVTSVNASQCFIKVEDAEIPALSDTLDAAFSIVSLANATTAKFKGGAYDGHAAANSNVRRISLTEPVMPDSVFGNTNYTINWKQNNIDRVNIWFSADNGISWQIIAKGLPADALKYDWNVSGAPTNTGKIRIEDALDTSFYTISSNAFVIKKKILRITGPDANFKVFKNTVLPVEWNSGGINTIRIRLLFNNRDSILVDSLPATLELYNWVIRENSADSFRLVLTDKADSTIADTSVLIKPQRLINNTAAKFKGGGFDGHTAGGNRKPTLQLLFPATSDALSVLNKYKVTWRSSNVERIALDLSVDSGRTWTIVVSDQAAYAAVYEWKTPNTPANNCLLRIRDVSDSTLFDLCDSVFSLTPKKVINTTDSTSWIKGTAKRIEWVANGVEFVRIQYRTAAAQSWQLLRDSVAGENEIYNWVLPVSLSDSIWIRTSDATDSSVNDVKSFFKATRSLVTNFSATKYKGGSFDGHSQRSNINRVIIKHPTANEILVGGTQFEITWTAINLEDSVLLQYSIDSGATWVTITRTVASAGAYMWTVPLKYGGNSFTGIQYGNIKTNAIGIVGVNGVGGAGEINSNKCQIRVLDIMSGNVLVGTSSNTFTIQSTPVIKQKDTINFVQPADMVIGQPAQQLMATATSKRVVKYLIAGGTAVVTNGLLSVNATGKVKIGAYTEGDAAYLSSDTIYKIICVAPAKPVIKYTGKMGLCYNDTAVLSANSDYPQYAWSTGDITKSIRVSNTVSISLKAGDAGCYSISSDTLVFNKDTTREVKLTLSGGAILCSGDSISFTSSVVNGNQWYKDGILLNNATDQKYTTTAAGYYTAVAKHSNGCIVTSTPIQVQVVPRPAKPLISRDANNNLVSSAAAGNQWYIDSSAIRGAIQQNFQPVKDGYYSVRVTLNGCVSQPSDKYHYLVTAILNVGGDHFIKLNPNPVSDFLFITHNLQGVNTVNMSVFDLNGKKIMDRNNLKNSERIDMSGFRSGMYLVRFYSTNGKINSIAKIIKL